MKSVTKKVVLYYFSSEKFFMASLTSSKTMGLFAAFQQFKKEHVPPFVKLAVKAGPEERKCKEKFLSELDKVQLETSQLQGVLQAAHWLRKYILEVSGVRC